MLSAFNLLKDQDISQRQTFILCTAFKEVKDVFLLHICTKPGCVVAVQYSDTQKY